MRYDDQIPNVLVGPEIKPPVQKPRFKRRTLLAVAIVVIVLIIAIISVYFLILQEKVTIYDISEIRELEVWQDVPYNYMSREELKDYVIDSVRDVDLAELEKMRLILDNLLLLEYEENLTQMLLDSLGTQIAGFYNLQTKEIYVIEGSSLVLDRVVLAHEFAHALQDQHFDLIAYINVANSDALMAREAVYEGDASLVQSHYMNTLSLGEMIQLVSEIEEYQGSMEDIPYAIQQLMSFPYLEGLSFIQDLYDDGGWDSVNDAYEYPPASTEQILHVDKYHLMEAPINVVFEKDVENLTLVFDETLGEFMIKIMLDNYISTNSAGTAAEGWGGDRFYFYENETDFLSVFKIEWDTISDADEFNTTYHTWMNELPSEYDQILSNNCLQIVQSQKVTTIYYSSSEDIINDTLN